MVISSEFFHSKSFEQWARQFVILDDKDESQWYGSGSELMFYHMLSYLRSLTSWSWLNINSQAARSELGFSANFPFDVDICKEFEMMMCDPFYTSLDVLSSGDAISKGVSYEPVPQPESPKLYFKEIKKMKDFTYEDG